MDEVGFGMFEWFMPLVAASELKGRLARGEIDTAEYEVRLRSLIQDRG